MSFISRLLQRLSWKFYFGIVLIIVSSIIGIVTKILFIIHLNTIYLKWLWVGLYLVSWPMLILGIWWAGRDYFEKIKKYGDYRFYHESVKSGTRRVYTITRTHTRAIGDKAKAHTAIVKNRVKQNLANVKNKLKKKS